MHGCMQTHMHKINKCKKKKGSRRERNHRTTSLKSEELTSYALWTKMDTCFSLHLCGTFKIPETKRKCEICWGLGKEKAAAQGSR